MIVLLLVSLMASPWAGLWRIEPTRQSHQSPHIYIHQDGTVEMFDLDWSAYDIHESKLAADVILIQFTTQDHTKRSLLTLKPDGNRLTGTMEIPAGGGQFPIKQPITAIRVAETIPSSPQKWIAEMRKDVKDDCIDVVARVLKAPRESFETFLKYWNEMVEPAFYPLLDHALYGKENDSQTRVQRLRRVFEHVSEFQEEASLRAAQAEQAVSEAAQSDPGLKAQMKEGACIVLLPAFDEPKVEMLPVATVRLERKPGQKFCCGSRGYKIENFVFVSLAPSAKLSSEGGDEESR